MSVSNHKRVRYKVGDKLYFETFDGRKSLGVLEHEIVEVEINYYTEHGTCIPEWHIGKLVFDTREAAEEYRRTVYDNTRSN